MRVVADVPVLDPARVACVVNGQPLSVVALQYLGTQRAEATFASKVGARVLLIGGPPFPEKILMWWNFIARTREEISEARANWEGRRRFGEVTRYAGRASMRPRSRGSPGRTPVSCNDRRVVLVRCVEGPLDTGGEGRDGSASPPFFVRQVALLQRARSRRKSLWVNGMHREGRSCRCPAYP